ncbi:MAG: UDP-3-O-acyl-N-acetylglucosamine deacetylase [Rickettsiales bacterium]
MTTDIPSVALQSTVARPISCEGIGLHTGKNIRMTMRPLEENSGVVFVRSDLGASDSAAFVKARFDNVRSTTLGTVLRNDAGAEVSTVEHVMAALWACGVDNCLVEVNGPEAPIMDGSAEPFAFMIDCAGVKKQKAKRRVLEIMKEVRVEESDGVQGKPPPYLCVRPADGFSVNMTIDFNDAFIRRQSGEYDVSKGCFRRDVARARTFGFADQVDYLRENGLALGGSLENAIVLKDGVMLNEEELRYTDEFVRHKILDCVGDLYLAGGYMCGGVEGYRSGHGLNNRLLRALFADTSAWRYREAE